MRGVPLTPEAANQLAVFLAGQVQYLPQLTPEDQERLRVALLGHGEARLERIEMQLSVVELLDLDTVQGWLNSASTEEVRVINAAAELILSERHPFEPGVQAEAAEQGIVEDTHRLVDQEIWEAIGTNHGLTRMQLHALLLFDHPTTERSLVRLREAGRIVLFGEEYRVIPLEAIGQQPVTAYDQILDLIRRSIGGMTIIRLVASSPYDASTTRMIVDQLVLDHLVVLRDNTLVYALAVPDGVEQHQAWVLQTIREHVGPGPTLNELLVQCSVQQDPVRSCVLHLLNTGRLMLTNGHLELPVEDPDLTFSTESPETAPLSALDQLLEDDDEDEPTPDGVTFTEADFAAIASDD